MTLADAMKALAQALIVLAACQQLLVAQQVDIEASPINYSKSADVNPVRELITRLDSGEANLDYDHSKGYLRSLLNELHIPVESQALVFSKTSMQVQYISRRNPRAIYFNDDVYVAWVRGSSLIEISAADPNLGAAFYTFQMMPDRATIKRENYNCLACHISSLTQGVPGHTVRSVFPKSDGTIDVQAKSFVTDHKSPFSERWGGWYVTGRTKMVHMGNAVLRGGRLDTAHSANLQNLHDEIDAEDWLTPFSDIVALMVLEHQTHMHNIFTSASFAVRQAMHDHDLAYGSGKQRTASSDATKELQFRISQSAKEVVDAMLFCEEAILDSNVAGSHLFANEFSNRGPCDKEGRSLRDFDLESRLFKYPCSYLVYSSAFDALPDELRTQVVTKLIDVLQERNNQPEYAHLVSPMRRDILEILRDTKPEFNLAADR